MADTAFEVVQEGDEGVKGDARVGADRVQARFPKQTSKEEQEQLAARRGESLAPSKCNKNAWQSDRLRGVAIDQTLRQRRREAAELALLSKRGRYLAPHKGLFFCEILSALNSQDPRLKEQFDIEILRFDGTLHQRERILARHDFEISILRNPKDFWRPER
ncbi:hypothetical protein LTR86_006347 [Recurvomyces mirabilis]|nr:hypothetical protein LTR86_006347 [Recurvomyces mirabilis]